MIQRHLLASLSIVVAVAGIAQAKLPRHDAAVEAILVPSDDPRFAELNPAVVEPRFILRNNGLEPLRGISVRYGTEGFQPRMYAWTGLLGSGASIEVTLPHLIDMRAGSNTFSITLGDPNGKRDGNKADNTRTTSFSSAPVLSGALTARWRVPAGTGGRLSIENTRGPMPLEHAWSAGADTVMSEALDLPVGSYVAQLTDSGRTAHASLRIRDAQGALLAVVRGKGRTGGRFQFRVEDAPPPREGPRADAELVMLPGRGMALVDAYANDPALLVVSDGNGEPVLDLPVPARADCLHRIDLSARPAGSYAITLVGKGWEHPVGRIDLFDGGPR